MPPLLSLLPLLLAASSLAAASETPITISGLLQQPVELLTQLPPNLPIDEVVWKFTSGGKTMKVAEIRNNRLRVDNRQFMNRLEESANGTVLRMLEIKSNDTGIYTAQITLTSLEIRHSSFNLTVYEPVPVPSIRAERKELSSNQCNVTLHAFVPENGTTTSSSSPSSSSSWSYSWKYRPKNSDYQTYNITGDAIQISLGPENWDMEILSIIYNPADQKNCSLQLPQICTLEKASYGRYYLLVLPGILALLTPLVIWLKRHKATVCKKGIDDSECSRSDLIENNSSTHGKTGDSPSTNHLVYATIPHQTPTRRRQNSQDRLAVSDSLRSSQRTLADDVSEERRDIIYAEVSRHLQ